MLQFDLEASIWLNRETPKFEVTITIPGLSPKYPEILSTKDGNVCLLTTGESRKANFFQSPRYVPKNTLTIKSFERCARYLSFNKLEPL
jgi:purine nucleoside permease